MYHVVQLFCAKVNSLLPFGDPITPYLATLLFSGSCCFVLCGFISVAFPQYILL